MAGEGLRPGGLVWWRPSRGTAEEMSRWRPGRVVRVGGGILVDVQPLAADWTPPMEPMRLRRVRQVVDASVWQDPPPNVWGGWELPPVKDTPRDCP